jgi:hypothetical protein
MSFWFGQPFLVFDNEKGRIADTYAYSKKKFKNRIPFSKICFYKSANNLHETTMIGIQFEHISAHENVLPCM